MAKLGLGVLAAFALAGCIGPLTPAQRVQEAAQDMNTAARFGRMDIAFERVSNKGREDFAKRHAAWGSRVRILDYDFQGLALKDQETAEVMVTIGWQRPDESDIRSTTIVQHWKDHRGSWLLESEERGSGDVGLL